jgi:hypothetical protein
VTATNCQVVEELVALGEQHAIIADAIANQPALWRYPQGEA